MKNPFQTIRNTLQMLSVGKDSDSAFHIPAKSLLLQTLEDRVLYDASPLGALASDIGGAVDEINSADEQIEVLTSMIQHEVSFGQAEEFSGDDSGFLLGPEQPLEFEFDSTARQLVVIDERIGNLQDLISGLMEEGEASVETVVVRVDQTNQDFESISRRLDGTTRFDAVHIIAFKGDDRVELGSRDLTGSGVVEFERETAGWTDGLATGAEIILYGFDESRSENGQSVDDVGLSLTDEAVPMADQAYTSVTQFGELDFSETAKVVEPEYVLVALPSLEESTLTETETDNRNADFGVDGVELVGWLPDADLADSDVRSAVIFVDAAVEDSDVLIEDLRSTDPQTQWIVIYLDGNQNGITQISESLAGLTGIDTVHLISHGDGVGIQLGNTRLDIDAARENSEEIKAWGEALDVGADFLIYGCDLASTDLGRELVDSIGALCDCDVAASDDVTGSASLGGDWDLEYVVGVVESSLVFSVNAQVNWEGTLDITSNLILHNTFDVDASDSSGNNYHGTLTNGALIDYDAGTNQVGLGKLSVDGLDDYVDLTSHVADFSGFTKGTIAAFVKTSDSHGAFLAANDSGDSNSAVIFYVWNGYLAFSVSEAGSYSLDVVTNTSINDDAWHHVAVTVDSSGNKLFIDGVQQTSLTYYDGNSSSQEFFSDVSNLDFMAVGSARYSSSLDEQLDGLIDDVRVYDRALTSSDISELNANNHAPVIMEGPDTAGLTETDAGLTDSGTLTVTDIDTTDIVTAAVDSVGVTGTGAGSVSGSLTNAILKGFLSVSPTTILDGTETMETLTWGFDSGTEAFDFLADGETLVLTYTVSATDDAGTPLSDTETVTVTITGTNDSPVISDGPGISALAETDSGLTDAGVLEVSDVDTTDIVNAAVASVAVSGTGAGSVPPALDNLTLRSFLSVTPPVILNGTQTTAALNWNFNSGTEAFDFLATGETLILTYTVSATDDDSSLAADTETVTITITGINDAPNISDGMLAATFEDNPDPNGQQISSIFGSNYVDPDAGSSLAGLAIVGNAANPTTEGVWQYSTNGGTNWHDIGIVNDTGSALAVDAATTVRFLAVSGFTGSPTSLSIRALDETYAGGFSTSTVSENRATVNTTANGGTTAIEGTTTSLSTSISGDQASLWVSVKDDDYSSGFGGHGSIEESEAIEITDPNLQFGTTSDGTVNRLFDLNAFSSDDVTLNGLHYVGSNVTLGGTNFPSIDVQKGDVLFTTESTVTLTSLNSVVADKSDIVLFRPTNIGDYSSGTFTVILDNPSGTDEIRGLTLVEQDTLIGDYTVQRGDFLITTSVGFKDMSVQLLEIDDVGAGSNTVGTVSILLDGTDPNVSMTEKLYGIELIETATSIGGISLSAGQILLTTEDSDTVGQNNLSVASQDIFALTVTQTTLVAGANNGYATAAMFFDGSDMNLDSVEEDLDAIALVNGNVAPTDIAPDSFAIDEHVDTSSGTSVGILTSTDPNTSETATYAIVGGLDAISFSIGGLGSDELILNDGVLDFESQSSYSVIVRVTDSGGLWYEENITVNVNDRNDAPTLPADVTIGVVENTTAVTTSSGSDVDAGDTLTYSLTGDDAALFQINAITQEVTFISAPDYEIPTDLGGDNNYEVTVVVTDDGVGNLTATQNITVIVSDVNEAPEITAAALTINEGETVLLSSSNISASDPDGDTLTITVSSVTGGHFGLLGNPGTAITVFSQSQIDAGQVVFVHDGNELAPSFVVAASDGALLDTEAATVTFSNTNDQPTDIQPDSASFNENLDTTSGLLIGSLTATDSDSGEVFAYAIVGGPDGGKFSITGDDLYLTDGVLDFERQASYSIIVRVTDSAGLTYDDSIMVNVNDINEESVVATNTGGVVSEQSSLTLTNSMLEVSDPEEGPEDLTFMVTSVPAFGIITVGGTPVSLGGTFTQADINASSVVYSHDGSETMSDQFEFQVSDGQGNLLTNQEFDLVVLPVNDAPVALNDGFTINEDNPLFADVVAPNDTDSENDTLIANVVAGPSRADSFVLNPDGTFTYQPNVNFHGTDSFTYQVSDGNGGFDTATATITVNSINDAPQGQSESYSQVAGSTLNSAVSVLANDFDVEMDGLVAIVGAEPSHGILTLSSSGQFSYEPNAGFVGSDSFTYRPFDGQSFGTPVLVSISITGGSATTPGGSGSEGGAGDGPGSEESDSGEDTDEYSSDEDGLGSVGLLAARDNVNSYGHGGAGPKVSQDLIFGGDKDQELIAAIADSKNAEAALHLIASQTRMSGSANGLSDDEVRELRLAGGISAVFDANYLFKQLDEIGETAILDDVDISVGMVTALGAFGYVLWTLRGSALVALALTQLPSWQMIDPLPILEKYCVAQGESDDEMDAFFN
ncbi:MAG: VCBS repeat-containing protein [Mariniblastus sp.]|jgi:VCBS repeat-containing protein